MKKKVVVSLSGGLDSAVVLARMINIYQGDNVLAVNFKYGSKHGKYEQQAAQKIAAHYAVDLRTVDLEHTGIFTDSDSALLDDTLEEIPEGHYQAPSMARTVVHGRNTVFAACLYAIAESVQAEAIGLGVHAGDHHIYPDCRPMFVNYLNSAIEVASEKRVRVIAPFVHVSKDYIVKDGLRRGVPFHLTRTCYKNQEVACGKCGSCVERLESFQANHATDPLPYEKQ